MITLTLIQGVVNTFVIFFARIVGYFVDRVVLKNDRGVGACHSITVIVCEIVFGVLASVIVAWYLRQREYRAVAGSANVMGSSTTMISAIARACGLEHRNLP